MRAAVSLPTQPTARSRISDQSISALTRPCHTHTHTTTTTARSPCALRSMPPPPSSPPLSSVYGSRGKKGRVDHEMNEPTEFVGNRSGGRRDPSAFFPFLLLIGREGREAFESCAHLGLLVVHYGTAKWRARLGKGFANNCYFKNGI